MMTAFRGDLDIVFGTELRVPNPEPDSDPDQEMLVVRAVRVTRDGERVVVTDGEREWGVLFGKLQEIRIFGAWQRIVDEPADGDVYRRGNDFFVLHKTDGTLSYDHYSPGSHGSGFSTGPEEFAKIIEGGYRVPREHLVIDYTEAGYRRYAPLREGFADLTSLVVSKGQVLPAPLAGIRFRERNGYWRSETEHRQYIGLDHLPDLPESLLCCRVRRRADGSEFQITGRESIDGTRVRWEIADASRSFWLPRAMIRQDFEVCAEPATEPVPDLLAAPERSGSRDKEAAGRQDEKRKEATFSEELTAILFPARAISKGAAKEPSLLFKARKLMRESGTSLPVQLTALLFPRRGLRLGALDDETLMGELRRRLRHSEINRKGSQ
jgi:hypothetical protein